MITLSKSEEQLMEFIWQQDKVFMKDLMELYPDPKPAVTTIATLLKRMQEKGFVAYHIYGNSRQYYPLVNKRDYFSRHIKNMIKDYFSGSTLNFASFFTSATDMSATELEELKKIVDKEIKKRSL